MPRPNSPGRVPPKGPAESSRPPFRITAPEGGCPSPVTAPTSGVDTGARACPRVCRRDRWPAANNPRNPNGAAPFAVNGADFGRACPPRQKGPETASGVGARGEVRRPPRSRQRAAVSVGRGQSIERANMETKGEGALVRGSTGRLDHARPGPPGRRTEASSHWRADGSGRRASRRRAERLLNLTGPFMPTATRLRQKANRLDHPRQSVRPEVLMDCLFPPLCAALQLLSLLIGPPRLHVVVLGVQRSNTEFDPRRRPLALQRPPQRRATRAPRRRRPALQERASGESTGLPPLPPGGPRRGRALIAVPSDAWGPRRMGRTRVREPGCSSRPATWSPTM